MTAARPAGTMRARAPELGGAWPAPAGARPPVRDTAALLDGIPHAALWTRGEWREGELRFVRCAAGTVLTLGQCLASEAQFAEDAARALAADRLPSLTRWPGSYLCLVMRPDDLTVFADLAGQYPLHYRQTGGRTYFGTRPVSVANASGGPRRPDPTALAARIFCPDVPLLAGERSVLAGVRRLGGGQALRIAADGTYRQWTYDPLLPEGNATFTDAADALGAALDTAVRLRAARGGRLTADLSGGLDSTSVAFLALRHTSAPLPVFTYHREGTSCDDLDYAERYARLDERLALEVVRGTSGTLTYQGLTCQGRSGEGRGGEPDPAAVAWARTRLRLERVARHGGGVHLGGEGGDALLVAPPAHLADLVRAGSLRRLCRDGRTLARSRHTSPLKVLTHTVELSRTPMATEFRQLAERLEHSQDPQSHDPTWLDAVGWWCRPGPESGWLTAAMRRELARQARARADEPTGAAGPGPGDRGALGELRNSAAVQRQLSEGAREFGVWPQAPFLDGDVIRACLRLPAHRRSAPPAVKPLLAAALEGRVPASVLSRRTKGDYTDEDYRGARAASGTLRGLLGTSRLAELGVIEPDAVTASLDRALMGLRAPLPALNRLLGVELWLRSTPWD
ncbi:albusnodin/ikarugamycin family macrolactam cyclase [Streptomyces sp. 8N706]|uniref:albusnodin/ikarugamycin family macrolactam cyclase n=1 Tax=Streptomyces sp. 8N706 TaxID=3457416 RepID=UPI003FD63BA4